MKIDFSTASASRAVATDAARRKKESVDACSVRRMQPALLDVQAQILDDKAAGHA